MRTIKQQAAAPEPLSDSLRASGMKDGGTVVAPLRDARVKKGGKRFRGEPVKHRAHRK